MEPRSTPDAPNDTSGFEKRVRLHATMVAVLREMRAVAPTDVTPDRLGRLMHQLVVEVASSLSDREMAELGALIGDVGDQLSLGESRIVTGQVVGWLDGRTRSELYDAEGSALETERALVARAQQEAALEQARLARRVL